MSNNLMAIAKVLEENSSSVNLTAVLYIKRHTNKPRAVPDRVLTCAPACKSKNRPQNLHSAFASETQTAPRRTGVLPSPLPRRPKPEEVS